MTIRGNMSKQMNSSHNIFKMSLKVLVIVIITGTLLSLSDGIRSLWSIGTLGLLTGPFTFLWWPYFRDDIGLQTLFGVIPVALIIIGIYFRSKRIFRFMTYIGGVVWVITGLIYVITHSV
jgi:hypothetical protein